MNTIPIAPDNIIVDTTVPRDVCDEFGNNGSGLVVPGFVFRGRNSPDAYGDVRQQQPGVGYAIEMDAHKFANQH